MRVSLLLMTDVHTYGTLLCLLLIVINIIVNVIAHALMISRLIVNLINLGAAAAT
jgi:hypothetical protein